MRLVHFQQDISGSAIDDLLVKLKMANAPDGVYVDSPGGEFKFFATMAPAIERRGIITLAGDVRSAANILYILGHNRYATEDSTFFFHEVRALVSGQDITICDLELVLEFQEYMQAEHREEFEEWLRQMKMAQGWFQEFIAKRTDLRPGVFADLMRANATLDAREAMRHGIVHRITSEKPVLV